MFSNSIPHRNMDDSFNRELELKLGFRLMGLTVLREAIVPWSALSIWPAASRRCECLTCYRANFNDRVLAVLKLMLNGRDEDSRRGT